MRESKPTRQQKKTVFERAGGNCEYCLSRADFSPSPFSAEHIVPRHDGGTNSLDNLAFSCQGCNNHKFTSTEALDPGSGMMAPLYNPRQERWKEHFDWSEDFQQVLGRTPTGRATVLKLQMNRPSVINLRRILRLDGKHPPKTSRE